MMIAEHLEAESTVLEERRNVWETVVVKVADVLGCQRVCVPSSMPPKISCQEVCLLGAMSTHLRRELLPHGRKETSLSSAKLAKGQETPLPFASAMAHASNTLSTQI